MQHSIGLRNLYEVTQIEEIINWLHELIAGVHVIKSGSNATNTDGKQQADQSDGDSGTLTTCVANSRHVSNAGQGRAGKAYVYYRL